MSDQDGSDPSNRPSGESPKDLDLEPVQRDPRFIVRLVLLALVGIIGASFIGLKLKGVAANCGAGLVRPGSSVVPPGEGGDAGR